MSTDVHVVSAGIISAIGNNITETLRTFETHQPGIGRAAHLHTRHVNEFPFGEVKLSNAELAALHQLHPALSRTILLSYHAAAEALQPFNIDVLNRYKCGFISASTVGGMDKTENFFNDFIKDPLTGDVNDVRHHDCGKPTDYVCHKLGLKGFVTTISTACSSSANAIMLGSRMIKAGKLDVVVAGGVDALTRFTLNGFNSLMIVDRTQCRPLDETREGLNLGEGASYLVLMSAKVMKELSATSWCKVHGYANTNDSFHQTALSDEGNGPFLAMQGALKMCNLKPEDIDYINMHGTGTQNNDNAEGKAVERIFHPSYPKLSSTKSFTGHTLGASGGIEATFSALAIKNKIIYPNFSFSQSIKSLHIKPEQKFINDAKVKHVLSNSFGFGGNCTSLIFSES